VGDWGSFLNFMSQTAFGSLILGLGPIGLVVALVVLLIAVAFYRESARRGL